MIFALLSLFLFLSDDEPNLKVMKKFFAVLFLASGLLSFTSCSEDPDGPEPGMIWDIAPFVINITVSDKDGNDLLNPETSFSIANNGIKAIFGGETFEMDSMPVADGQSRAILAVFRGLYSYQGSDGRYRLSFGEFAGDRNYDPQELVIDWNDGTPNDTIVFSHSFWWENHEPEQKTVVYLNGKETDAPVAIVK